MSEQGTQVSSNAPQIAPAIKTLTDEMKSVYSTKGLVVCLSGADEASKTAFAEFAGAFGEDDPMSDWTEGVNYENPTFAAISSDDDENRLVAFPSLEVALGDNVVRNWAYTQYLKAGFRAAGRERGKSLRSQFATASGFLSSFDVDAFRFQAKSWVAFFHEKGLKSLTIQTLRRALSSQPYAVSMFPRVPKPLWEKVLGAMSKKASEAGKDASIFSHWLSVRDIATDIDLPELEIGDADIAGVEVPTKVEEKAAA